MSVSGVPLPTGPLVVAAPLGFADGVPFGFGRLKLDDEITLTANVAPPPRNSSTAATISATRPLDRFFGTNGTGSGWNTSRYAAAARSSAGGGPRRLPESVVRRESIRDPLNCGGVGGASPPSRGVGAANGVPDGAETPGFRSSFVISSPLPPGRKCPGLGAGLSAITSRFSPVPVTAGPTPMHQKGRNTPSAGRRTILRPGPPSGEPDCTY